MGRIFRQIRNDARDIAAIADGYKTKIGHELWLADGLQKDAIQNSWDARANKKHGTGWECGFTLLRVRNENILCISDSGTTGLNGRMFNEEDELVAILNENSSGEDLAYFLNSNWSAKSVEEGGNRGRGKTLFLAASQDKKILFETLRSSDNVYIFGALYLDADNQVKFTMHDGEQGVREFESALNKMLPQMDWCGTRIFIVNPDPQVVESVNGGELISFISNSRWEIIKKYEAKIFVKNGAEKKYATLPYWYEDSLKDIQGREYAPEIIKDGSDYKIRRLVLRYAPTLNLPETLRGVAIQRGGMTIQRIKADELVHEVGTTEIYGWIEMQGNPLEEEMKTLCEGPEHFDFIWTTKPAKYLRDYLRSKIREFAKEVKIVDSEQAKKNKIQKTAEDEALKLLIPLFKKLGLFGKHKGKRKQKKPSTRNPNEPLRLSIPDIQFPNDNRRVNYGQKIQGAYVVPINEFGESLLALVRVYIVSSNGKTEILQEKEINLHSGEGPHIGADEIVISKKYKPGGYSLRARMIALEDKDKLLPDNTRIEKGTILYERINQKFYVEIDPPESGPFEFQPKGRDDKGYIFEWEPEGEGYIVYYNEFHPHIKPLLIDAEKLRDYLMEQLALIAFQIKLEELTAEDDDSDDEFTQVIKSKDPSRVWRLFLKRYSEFLWDLKK